MLVLVAAAQAQSPHFYAYYTRLDYDIPVVDDNDKAEVTGRITGKYADIVVNIDEERQFVFSRESSYLPYLETKSGKWHVEEIVPRQSDVKCLYSYARIVEDEPNGVLVHWRYVPDLNNVGFTGVVHEYFTVTPDGRVTREVRQATSKVDEWIFTAQQLELTTDGIKESFRTGSRVESALDVPREGSTVKSDVVGTPLAWWRFDDGLTSGGDLAKEEVSGRNCDIDGNQSLWKEGVSGTALAFDGYHSKVSMAFPESPDRLGNQLTLEGWVVLGAYPWNLAPVVHQSNPGGMTPKGYYLGVDDTGHPVLRVCVDGEWGQLVSTKAVELNRWTHVAGTFDGREGVMRVYLDGEKTGELTGRQGRMTASPEDILIGLNNTPARATHHVSEKIGGVRPKTGDQPRVFGIEGLIDEVKIYGQALSPEDVLQSYDNLKPSPRLAHDPDIEPRVLPGHPGTAERFGASYAKLKYHELWDNLWRTSDHPDIVVKFDNVPTSVVFWRGTNYGFGLVTDANHWMVDQSVEEFEEYGCMEHMSDKQNRFTYVKLIENTDARVVVHWRYAVVDILYQFPKRASGWADEYFFIYPDGVVMRNVVYRAKSWPGWQTLQFLTQQGQRDEDVVHLQALTVADLDGDVLKLDWTNGPPAEAVENSTLKNHSIQVMNFKSDYKVFFVGEEDTKLSWLGGDSQGNMETSPYLPVHFAGPWNHWPIAQIPNDGRFSVALDRVSSYAFAASEYDFMRGYAMYGFTGRPISELAPLARSWANPPSMSEVAGGVSRGYDKSQRAYQLVASADTLSFKLNGAEDSPIVNPCFVIKNWGSSIAAGLKIDGEEQPDGPDFRQGIVRDTDGTPTMVVWVQTESTSALQIEITKEAGMSEQVHLSGEGSQFEQDLDVLKEHTDVIVLSDEAGVAQVALVPAYQGRVMTSTTDGQASFGWINHELIKSGEVVPHINAYGGEERFWLGPEGGQFTVFFKQGDPFDWDHWQVPAILDTERFEIVSQNREGAALRGGAELTNYSGVPLSIELDRTVQLLDAANAEKVLGVPMPRAVKVVGYETSNTLTNVGEEPWNREAGALSIWMLGMYKRSDQATVVIPFAPGPEDELGPKVNDTYFGKVPSDRLIVRDDVLFFRVDSPYRSKIGLSPQRAKPVLGSYDGASNVLTVLQYTKPEGAVDYVSSMWEIQDDPFSGDVVNSYNDGPPEPGAEPFGPFYELESSSPAAFLAPNESITHVQRTIHIQGEEIDLDPIARATLGTSIDEIKNAFK
jgi:hypothetical protein